LYLILAELGVALADGCGDALPGDDLSMEGWDGWR